MKTDSAIKVGILASSNYITVLVNTILFPIFPTMAQALNLDLRDLAILVGIVSFPAAIINLVGGILADGFGRKVVIVISLFLYGIGGLVVGLAVVLMDNPYPVMLAGRLLQGLGSATPMFLTVALVGDIFQSIERSKALGFLETANGLGKVSSPILGGVIGLISWYAVFFLYPLVAFPVAIATWIYIQEPTKAKGIDWDKQKKGYALFKNTSRILALAVAFIGIFVLIGTMFWLSDFLATRLNISQFFRGIIIAIPAIAMLLTAGFAGNIAKKISSCHIMGGGLFLMSMGLLLIPFSVGTLFFWITIIIIGIGSGLVLPAIDTISTAVDSANIRGISATIFGASRSLGASLAPITFSFLIDYGLRVTFISISIATFIAAGVVLVFFQADKILPADLLPH